MDCDHRSIVDQGLDRLLGSVPSSLWVPEDLAPGWLVDDEADLAGEFLSQGMDDNPRVGHEVGHPISSPRRAGDVEPPINPEPPDLDADRAARSPAPRRDVDRESVRQPFECFLVQGHAGNRRTSSALEVKATGPAPAYDSGMSFWKSLKEVFKREAADVQEGLSSVRDKLDDELAKRERELEASPSERIETIQSEIEASSSRMDELEAEIDSRSTTSEPPDDLRRD